MPQFISGTDPERFDAILAALSTIIISMLGKLTAKGLLTTREVQEIFDQPMHSMEEWGLTDDTNTRVHHYLATLLAAVSGDPQQPLAPRT